jgi:RimJ/RimL family protein N-acetyltransferase
MNAPIKMHLLMSKLDFQKNYILEDNRVKLRLLREDDYNNLLPFSLQEPDTWKYSLVGAEGEEGLKNYLAIALRAWKDEKEYPFIVFDKKSNEYAGCTRFYDINEEFKSLQLGYTWYGEKFRGTGLNKHCKFLLLSFAFEQLGMERFELRADNNNERSIAAMKSIGCKVDGVLRSNMPTRNDNQRRDSIVLSILKDEWFSGVKENLKKKLFYI